MKTAIAILALAAAPILATAQAESAPCNCYASVGQLLNTMQAGTPQASMVVSMYLAGVSDAGQGVVHCSPPDVGTSRVIELVVPALRQADGTQLAAQVVLRVMRDAYPCTSNGKPAGPARPL